MSDFDRNFKIKVQGNWCEYQPHQLIDLREIKSFVCYEKEMGGPYRFYLKSGDYTYIPRYEIGKQIEDALIGLDDQQSKIDQLENKLKEIGTSIDAFFDEQVDTPTSREYSNFIADLGKALRGEHE